MLSPADHYRGVPAGRDENLALRHSLRVVAAGDRRLQADLLRMCAEDARFYVNLFVWQYNPRAVPRVAPFVLWPFQADALVQTLRAWAGEETDVLWEKSRELGATWLALIAADWLCLFHKWEKVLAMSHTEDAVDRPEDPDSLFWKLDFMHARLPDWMSRGVRRRKLGFVYPATDSVITGAATTERSGVGGRGKVLLDEFSKHRQAKEILGQTADTGPRLFIGTHYGVGTTFYDLTRRPDLKKVVMHWSDHPSKGAGLYRADPARPTIPEVVDTKFEFPADYPFVLDGSPSGGARPGLRSPWYDAECRRRADSRDVAMHLDIDPLASVKQFFDPLQVQGLIAEAREPVWEGEVECDVRGNFLGITPQPGGRLRLWVRPDGFGTMPAARYCGGADVSAGTGATNSCFAAIDGGRSLKVLEWADPRTEERRFAAVCVALCRWLKDGDGQGAYFAWDSSGQQGVKFTRAVTEETRYGNIYFNEQDTIRYTAARGERKPGWYGSNEQRYSALKDYRAALYSRTLADRSERCLRETLRFEYEKKTGVVQHAEEERANDPTGARKNHGDMVIATAVAWMLAKELAEGGRKAKPKSTGPEPMTVEWMLELQEMRRRRLEEAY